jgi:hypothetical protein
MFGIGGFNPVSLLATSMLGPVGGMVAQLATQVMSQFGQQLIQNLGNQMGLPQSAIDFAQAGFAGNYGDVGGAALNLNEALEAFGNEIGSSPSEIGDSQRNMQDLMRDIANRASESDDVKEAKAGGKGGSWLRALSEILGAKLDAKADELTGLAQKAKDDPSTSMDFSTASQEFNILSNAATTSIKSIGEALSNIARKQ